MNNIQGVSKDQFYHLDTFHLPENSLDVARIAFARTFLKNAFRWRQIDKEENFCCATRKNPLDFLPEL
jgi:hypothetical protein